MIKILFVCMGNICRSPTAEGMFRHKVEQAGLEKLIHIDSAGTHAYHVGEPPDGRAQKAAKNRDIDLSNQRARRVNSSDFEEFDYVIAMDASNESDLLSICPVGLEDKIHLFLKYASNANTDEVPDPYYGSGNGFEILQMGLSPTCKTITLYNYSSTVVLDWTAALLADDATGFFTGSATLPFTSPLLLAGALFCSAGFCAAGRDCAGCCAGEFSELAAGLFCF